MFVCLLASCGANSKPEALIEKADKALLENAYKVTMSIKTGTDDDSDDMDNSVEGLEVYIDGDNYAFSMAMSRFNIDLRCVDSVVYYTVSSQGQSVKMKITVTDEQRSELLGSFTDGASVNASDFGELSVEEKDGKTVISCNALSTEAINKLIADEFGDDAEELGMDVEVISAELKAVIADEKYESTYSKVVFKYVFDTEDTYGDDSYNMTVEVDLKYEYEGIPEISAPSDADTYTVVNYDDIF